MEVLIVNLVISLVLIASGFLSVRYPMLISGYNTLPKARRSEIDIRPYALFLRKAMFVMGGTLIIGSICIYLAGLKSWLPVFMAVVLLPGSAVVVWKGRHLAKEVYSSKSQKWLFRISMLLVVLVILFIVDTGRPAKIDIQGDDFVIHNRYGVKIPLASITDVEIMDQPPATTFRSNGLSFGKYHKGYFYSEEYGHILLFFHSGQGPYLLVKSTKELPVFINRSSPEEIMSLYSQLKKEDKND